MSPISFLLILDLPRIIARNIPFSRTIYLSAPEPSLSQWISRGRNEQRCQQPAKTKSHIHFELRTHSAITRCKDVLNYLFMSRREVWICGTFPISSRIIADLPEMKVNFTTRRCKISPRAFNAVPDIPSSLMSTSQTSRISGRKKLLNACRRFRKKRITNSVRFLAQDLVSCCILLCTVFMGFADKD